MNILVLNSGSNSLKFDIVVTEPNHGAPDAEITFGSALVSGSYDDIGKPNSTFSLKEGKPPTHQENLEVRDYSHAADRLLDWIENSGAAEQGIRDLSSIHRVGHRVVHGADRFNGPAELTHDVISRIEELQDLAPLHNASALQVIHATRNRTGWSAHNIAVFDTVFHQSIPDHAALYALPQDLATRYGIRRYGFHGISHRYMSIRYAQITGRPLLNSKLIILHLEGGSSAAALKNGRSIDTSMGFTPLEGLMMGTRCGDIDPAIVTYLIRKENKSGAEVESFLNKECGLLGVSGKSGDTRELVKHLDDPAANLAIDMFSYRVRKYIGAYLAALGGAQAIVVGGGIGENTSVVRERVFTNLAWCGAILDPEKNRQTINTEGLISTHNSPVEIWVIPTEENLMIAKDVADYTL